MKELIDFKLFQVGQYELTVFQMVLVFIVFISAWLILFILKRAISRGLPKRFNKGQSYAYYQFSKYIIITIAIALILESLGIKITILLAGSAALLVGVGLGLQQFFNDIVCGFIILTENSIKVDDIIEVDNIVARVKQIGLRTSKVETRDNIIMILPNSKIVNESVTNWTHNKSVTRFSLKVGVAYGSDVNKVKDILESAAKEQNDVYPDRSPTGRFVDFGESALIFELLFWSSNRFRIEDVKSQLRFEINKKFIEEGVRIPFPQRDVHLYQSIDNDKDI